MRCRSIAGAGYKRYGPLINLRPLVIHLKYQFLFHHPASHAISHHSHTPPHPSITQHPSNIPPVHHTHNTTHHLLPSPVIHPSSNHTQPTQVPRQLRVGPSISPISTPYSSYITSLAQAAGNDGDSGDRRIPSPPIATSRLNNPSKRHPMQHNGSRRRG